MAPEEAAVAALRIGSLILLAALLLGGTWGIGGKHRGSNTPRSGSGASDSVSAAPVAEDDSCVFPATFPCEF